MRYYSKRDYTHGEPLPEMPDGFWTKQEFHNSLDHWTQRQILVRDFRMFHRPDNNQVALTGTRYNFYTEYWMFGYPEAMGKGEDGKQRYTMVCFTFETLLDAKDVSNEVKERLVFHVDFFSPKNRMPKLRGFTDKIAYIEC